MINMLKNIVSSENDAKKYHLQSYHEMLEIALLKDYQLNQNFLKSIQEAFGISQHEHSIIMQAIQDSNEMLNINIINILQKMDVLCEINNTLYEDFTVEIDFLKNIIQEEFNAYSEHFFHLLENIYANHESEFEACKRAFSYEKNEVIGLNTKVYSFLSPTITKELEKIHQKIHYPTETNQDNNLELISKLLTMENENITIACLLAMRNYTQEHFNLSEVKNFDNADIVSLLKKMTQDDQEVHVYEKVAYLSRVPLFAALSFEELYSVAGGSTLRNYKEGEAVIAQGENTHNLYVILSGEVDVYKNNTKINELNSGDFFGEIAIVAMTKRTATIIASSDLSVLVFSEKAFNLLINKYPNISVQIMKVMTNRLLQNNS